MSRERPQRRPESACEPHRRAFTATRRPAQPGGAPGRSDAREETGQGRGAEPQENGLPGEDAAESEPLRRPLGQAQARGEPEDARRRGRSRRSSRRNWSWISRGRAPTARRRPISPTRRSPTPSIRLAATAHPTTSETAATSGRKTKSTRWTLPTILCTCVAVITVKSFGWPGGQGVALAQQGFERLLPSPLPAPGRGPGAWRR